VVSLFSNCLWRRTSEVGFRRTQNQSLFSEGFG